MSEFSRNLAVVIGINNYGSGISPLATAVNDAKKLQKILRLEHGYGGWMLLDELATLKNINRLLEKTLPLKVTADDRLLFYFAGRGIALNGEDGPEGYLLPQDAKEGNTDSYLPMTQWQSALSHLPCRHFLGILDCCFAGTFRWSSPRQIEREPEVLYQELYDRFITNPTWQVITSATSDHQALKAFNFNTERGQVGDHSPFAAALIEALAGKADIYPPATNGQPPGDGVITATELYLYLRDAVEPATEGESPGQSPGIWTLNKQDKGDYIFLSPGKELNLPPAPTLDASKNPYRGLESYEEEHSEVFFGRTELVKKLRDFVKTHPLTVVLGASGSGKSSLVKAGLIPKLRKDNTEQWYILPPIRPGEIPLQALNNALKNAQLPELEPQNPQKNLAMSIDVWAKNDPNSKLLLFIDQSEEIITLCQNKDERKEFFQEIFKAINAHGHRLRVLLSLRSDFEPLVKDASLKSLSTVFNLVLNLGNTEFKNLWQGGRFIVPPMTQEKVLEVIEKPAETQVMYYQSHELVEQLAFVYLLIDEVAELPRALPLLSFALSELYFKYLKRQGDAQKRGITIDRVLTQEDYQDLGGVPQLLNHRADLEYEALVNENPAYAQIIPIVMLRMVVIGRGELARRRVPLSELEELSEKNGFVKEVIEHFTKARLLVEGQDADGNPFVEPAHEALVQGWQKLLEWKQEAEESLLMQPQSTPAVEKWKSFRIFRNWGIALAIILVLATGLVFQRNVLIFQTENPDQNQQNEENQPNNSPNFSLTPQEFSPALQALAEDYHTRGNEETGNKYIENFPNILAKSSTNAQKADAYVNRGVIYFRQKKYDLAIKDYTKAIALAPKNVHAHINRGIAYATQKDHERAIEDYNKAIGIAPDNADAYINRGIAYSSHGYHKQASTNYDKANQDYEDALLIDPDNADAYYARGVTLAAQGRKQEALEAYHKAEELYRKQGKTDYSQSALNKIQELQAQLPRN